MIPALQVLRFEPAESRSGVDALATVRVGDKSFRLAIEWQSAVDSRNIGAAVARIKPAAGSSLPVLGSSYIPPSVRRRLEQAGVGWLDAVGGIHLEGPGLLVHIEHPTPRGHVPRAKGDPFGSAAGRIVQAMLEDPSRAFDLETLRQAADVASPSTVSRGLASLVDAGQVTRGGSGWMVSDAQVLMDAWLDAQLMRPSPRRVGFFSRGSVTRVREQIAEPLVDGYDVLTTGPAAAEMLLPLLPASELDLYVFPPAFSSTFAEHTMSWIPTNSAPNINLWIAGNDGPRVGERIVAGVPIVGKAQLILDLLRVGGRRSQVAQELRQEWGL